MNRRGWLGKLIDEIKQESNHIKIPLDLLTKLTADSRRLDKLIEWLGLRDDFSESGCRDWEAAEDARKALDEWGGIDEVLEAHDDE